MLFLVAMAEHFSHAAAFHDYSDKLTRRLLFFKGQCLGKLPPEKRLRWQGDSTLHDSATEGVDLTGKHYDAGDNIKFIFPMAFTEMLLSWV